MVPSNLVFLHLSLVLLLATSLTVTRASSSSLLKDLSQSNDDQLNPKSVIADHYPSYEHFLWKPTESLDDSPITVNSNDPEFDQIHWPHFLHKRYSNKVVRGDNRLWAIPYRFGKRGVMPYRFGKRAVEN